MQTAARATPRAPAGRGAPAPAPRPAAVGGPWGERACGARAPRAVGGAERTAGGAASPWRGAGGAPLTKDEAASLRAVLAPPPGAAALGMGADPAEASQRAAALLLLGLSKQAQDLVALEGAVLVAEQVRACAAAGPAGGRGGGGGGGGGIAQPWSRPVGPTRDTPASSPPCSPPPRQANLGKLPPGSGTVAAASAPALLRGDAGVASVGVWQPVFASAGGFPRCALPLPGT
jgi:hypothetical protein